jgi:hypothetical protein
VETSGRGILPALRHVAVGEDLVVVWLVN